MGMESYNFILVSQENNISFDDDILEINSEKKLAFVEVVKVITTLNCVNPYTPKYVSKNNQKECYFSYHDQISIIEIEINAGTKEDFIEEISIRFSVTHCLQTFKKAIEICKIISDQLYLSVIDMRLKEVINLSDELQIAKSKHSFQAKRKLFCKLYNLSEESYFRSLHCDKDLFEEIKK